MVKIGLKTIAADSEWDALLEMWQVADSLGAFDSAWLNDHLLTSQNAEGGMHEAWTLAAALGTRTKHLVFGHLVLANTYRHPPLLMKMATTMDHVAHGRFVLGLGAAWDPVEHQAFGYDLPPLADRITMLGDTVRFLKGVWASTRPFSYEGLAFRVNELECIPPPLTDGGPPIWLGTRGRRRGLRLTAELADGWTTTVDDNLADFVENRTALLDHCDAVGRDPDTLEISVRLALKGTDHKGLLNLARACADNGAGHIILAVPPAIGPRGIRRLATEVAEPLRGAL